MTGPHRAKPRNVLDLGSHETGQSALRAGLGRLSPPKEMTLLEHCSKLFRVVYGAWWVLLAPLYLLFNVCKVAERQPSYALRLKGGVLYMDPPFAADRASARALRGHLSVG